MKQQRVKKFLLHREFAGDNGLIGTLRAYGPGDHKIRFPVRDAGDMVDARGKLFTAERLWQNNEPNVSCIPFGEYRLEKRSFGGFAARMKKRFGHEFVPWIRGCEPARSAILIHPGNNPVNDCEGCILPGLSKNIYDGVVGRSADACKALYEVLAAVPEDHWPIPFYIIDAYGPCNAS